MAARARGEPLTATASQVSAWLLVEVIGTWGKDAVGQSELGPFAPSIWRKLMRRQGIRVIAIRRDVGHRSDHHGALRLVHIVAPRPGGRPGSCHRRMIHDLHEVVWATESLANGEGPDARWEVDDERYVLVCTNGRHDACCATFGRPVMRALRTSQWANEVWECSHVGGDRFAANVVLLPDSLYFGDVEPHSAATLLIAHAEGRLDLSCFRGRSTFRLPEQVAEHAVREQLGLEELAGVVAVTTLPDGRISVDVADGRTAHVSVRRVDRPSPTPLTCKGQEGLKYPEFEVLSIDVAPS